ncbi:MAG: hypothetical protein JXQ90_02350 [Cyclobacteriaceae bacterium]
MKKLYSILFILTLGYTQAAVITVDNASDSNADYSDLQVAIDSANAGDTIYVAGSNTSYGSAVIEKSLSLFGAGHNPNTQRGLPSKISSFQLRYDIGEGTYASNSVISGFWITSSCVITGRNVDNKLENLKIIRNRFAHTVSTSLSLTYVDGVTVKHNLFGNKITLGNGEGRSLNVSIANNLILGGINQGYGSSIIIQHNTILGFYGGNSSTQRFTFSDNLWVFRWTGSSDFYLLGAEGDGTAAGLVVNNNYIYHHEKGTGTISLAPAEDMSGSGNVEGELPIFEDFVFADHLTSPSNIVLSLPQINLRLDPSSPGYDDAGDGTQVGMYGGSDPFPSGDTAGGVYDLSPVPTIPQVTEMDLSQTTVGKDGTLNVTFKAKVNN